MTTAYDMDEDGNIIVVFDSRWRFPEILGYSPLGWAPAYAGGARISEDDPQYKALRRMWEEVTAKENRGG